MKERPILFKGEMVRAILEGRKTVTRRPVKERHFPKLERFLGGLLDGKWNLIPLPYGQPGDRLWVRETFTDVNFEGAPAITYRADDELRDLMAEPMFLDEDGAFNYSDPRWAKYPFACWFADFDDFIWRPSIFMPRWASRILLEVTAVRVERLQDISEEQAIAEGCYTNDQYGDLAGSCDDLWPCPACNGNQVHQAGSMGGATEVDCNECRTAALRFRHLWVSINGPDSWDANPWVWVVEFKRIEP